MQDCWARHVERSGRIGNDYWHYFGQRLADLAAIPPGSTMLDVGTCDGNVLFKAMQRAVPRGYGVGIDSSSAGLKDGVEESNRHGYCDTAFTQMDAAHLGFPAKTFDNVLVNLVGWDPIFDFHEMKFIAPDHWTAEIMRVLKRGGQVGIGGWTDQSDIEWIVAAIRRHLPERVAELDREAQGRTLAYGKTNREGVEIVLGEGGFRDLQLHLETADFASPDEETWWRQMTKAARTYFKQVPEDDDDTMNWLKERVFADLQGIKSGGVIRFSKTVLFALGTK